MTTLTRMQVPPMQTEAHEALGESPTAGQTGQAHTNGPAAPGAAQPDGSLLSPKVRGRAAAALVALVASVTSAGAGFAWGGAGAAATEGDLAALEKRMNDERGELANRIDDLEPLVQVSEDAYQMGALALEISVESHRYTADLIVDVAQLDHPDYEPLQEDPRLARRLRNGEGILDDLETPRP